MAEYLPLLKFVSQFSSALFAGGVFYCSLVEHPSMVETSTKSAADHWNSMFKRAAPLQVCLVLTSTASSFAVYYLSQEKPYLYSALLLSSIIPYTIAAMMPTNHALLDPKNDRESARTKELIKKWGNLHAVRSLIGLGALGLVLKKN